MEQEKKSVYCQTCSADLTNEGGYVSDDGRVFCYSLLMPRLTCGDVAAKHSLVTLKFSYKDSETIQKEIAEGKIIYFSSLEKSVSN